VPNGYQSYGSAVVNENGVELFLYCTAGTAVAANLGCDFLDQPPAPPVTTYSCSGGVCSPDPSGIYPSLAACQAALIPPPFTGGQCVGILYSFNLRRNGNIVQSFTSLGTLFGFYFNDPVTSFGVFTSFGDTPLLDSIDNFPEYAITDITRDDGLPDNCGNAPPTCPI
jgi:hypothetical protein